MSLHAVEPSELVVFAKAEPQSEDGGRESRLERGDPGPQGVTTAVALFSNLQLVSIQ
jgi:hypothetical protein